MTTENTEQPKTDFILSEEQTMLRDTAKQFFSEQVPISNLRKLRDEESVDGIDREVWKQAAELGLAGILIPEVYGGTDFGVTGMGLVMEEAGRTLAATPLFSSSILSTLILLEAASEGQKQAILPAIAKGEMELWEQGNQPRLNTQVDRLWIQQMKYKLDKVFGK